MIIIYICKEGKNEKDSMTRIAIESFLIFTTSRLTHSTDFYFAKTSTESPFKFLLSTVILIFPGVLVRITAIALPSNA